YRFDFSGLGEAGAKILGIKSDLRTDDTTVSSGKTDARWVFGTLEDPTSNVITVNGETIVEAAFGFDGNRQVIVCRTDKGTLVKTDCKTSSTLAGRLEPYVS